MQYKNLKKMYIRVDNIKYASQVYIGTLYSLFKLLITKPYRCDNFLCNYT